MLFHRIYRVAAFVLLALLALLLSACSTLFGVGDPTPIPPSDTAHAGPPTVVAQATTFTADQSTAVPAATVTASQSTAMPVATVAAGQPTAAPATRPTFAFEPRQGGPGSTISVRGWGFAPSAPVKLGLGFPAYTGAPLGLTNANARGEWQVRVSMPDVQPSPGPDWSKTLLIVLDGNDRSLASAPFSFIFDTPPAPQDPHPAVTTISTLLDVWGKGDVRPLLAANLRQEVDAGRPIEQVLGLAVQGSPSYSIGNPVPASGNPNTVFVEATLGYATTYTDVRQFTLVLENNSWKIAQSQLVSTTQQPAPTNPVISFNPSEGTAGTTVSTSGSGYVPGTNVAIRLGLPNPVGEVLAVGNVDASGRWSATLVLPDRLPSGDSIPDGTIRLVAMNDRNEALASAPFTFHVIKTEPVPGND